MPVWICSSLLSSLFSRLLLSLQVSVHAKSRHPTQGIVKRLLQDFLSARLYAASPHDAGFVLPVAARQIKDCETKQNLHALVRTCHSKLLAVTGDWKKNAELLADDVSLKSASASAYHRHTHTRSQTHVCCHRHLRSISNLKHFHLSPCLFCASGLRKSFWGFVMKHLFTISNAPQNKSPLHEQF